MVRNKKFHAYRANGYNPTWSGKNDEIPTPAIIWAKDLQDAKSILYAGGNADKDFIIIEAKDD